MRRLFIASLVVLSLTVGFSGFPQRSEATRDEILEIRVTSADSTESLMFEGAYLFKTEDSPLKTIKQQTPFTVQAKSDWVTAIFRKGGGKPDLRVELFLATSGSKNPIVAGAGKVLIIGTLTKPRGNTYFVRVF